MKLKTRLLYLLSISAASITFLSGCGQSPKEGEYVDVDGHPAKVVMTRMDSLEPPEGFEDSLTYKVDNPEQKQKFIFDAKPGEDIVIVNPTPEIITKEDIERDVTIRDAYKIEEEDLNRTVLYGESSPYLKYHLVDVDTFRGVDKLAPRGRALLRLDEPTEGGDLTIYEKEEGSPLNFEGKDPSVNQLIVATEREDVIDFSTKAEDIKGLKYSLCVDVGDLNHEIRGTFVYQEKTNLTEGDQFYIGDSDTFDDSATFYTFIKEEARADGSGYTIQYDAPDYNLCYNVFNVHQEETPINLDPEKDSLDIPTAEEIIRSLEKDGRISDLISDEVEQELHTNEELANKVIGRKWDPSININIKIDSWIVGITIAFTFGGPAIAMNFNINFTTVISSESYGSWLFNGGVSLYIRKTFSTYIDCSVELIPPKINYIVAVKTITEISANFYLGIAFGMKPADPPKSQEKEIIELSENLNDKLSDVPAEKGDPSGEGEPSVVGKDDMKCDPNQNVVDNPPQEEGGDEIEPILSYNSQDDVTSKEVEDYDSDFIMDYDSDSIVEPIVRAVANGDDHDYGNDEHLKKRYSGTGLVVSGPGVNLNIGPVTIEIGIAAIVNPNVQGRFFVTYNRISCEVSAKVVKGFDVPEGFGDDVEYSRSTWTIGIYVKLGVEIGVMVELQVYGTGFKKIFYASLQITFGIYFTIQGVGIILFGTEVDTTFMVYASIEAGFFIRVCIVLNILDSTFIINIKAWEYKWPPFFAFGTNLHFMQFIDTRDEFEWVGGRYININDMNVLEMAYFNSADFTTGHGHFDWNYRAYYSSTFGSNYKRLFKKLEITKGSEYLTFKDDYAYFEVNTTAPDTFDFSFKISIDPWLGCTCDPKSYTVHYFSNLIRAINFNGYTDLHEEGGVHVGGGLLRQGEIYQAPAMPDKDPDNPFFGWLGSNGLFLRAGEQMEVGSTSITFNPVYQPQATYVVNFYDGHNELISSQKIAAGGSAVEPNPETRDKNMGDATFVCWDRAFNEVYSNFNVYGIYAKGGKN